ncbi:MAG TPA: YlxR family protein [Trichormus sp.]|jgi:predicted RNA-binding protein YlxR (DUF448 family)
MNQFTVGDKSDPSERPIEPDRRQKKNACSTLLTRICIACRCRKERHLLIKVTVDYKTYEVVLGDENRRCNGRSAYLCKKQSCVTQALKGTRLRAALEGRKGKNLANRRTIKWPLEPQLIQQISAQCAEG